MTRQEFEEITSWWELLEFCNDNGLCACEDIMDEGVRMGTAEGLPE